MALREAIYVADALNDLSYVTKYNEILSKTTTAYQKSFWNSTQKAYCLSTQKESQKIFPELTQALTICAGHCKSKNEELSLSKKLTENAFLPKITLSHKLFYYQALMKNPQFNAFILNDVEKTWGQMLFKGATSFLETADGAADFENAGSLCHGWSSIPLYVYNKLLKNDKE